MKKAVKIKETFSDFLENHPEISASRDEAGNLFLSPSTNVEKWSYTNYCGIIALYYEYNGNTFVFSGEE